MILVVEYLKRQKLLNTIFVSLLLTLNSINAEELLEEPQQSDYRSECYDLNTGVAKKCMPEFTNAAYGLKIIASNTCGVTQPTEYCLQSNLHNLYQNTLNGSPVSSEQLTGSSSNDFSFYYRNHPRCEYCDDKDKRHPAEYLNDYNNQGNVTWWQSETMLEGVQYPNSVNLTLHLGKSFEINYVQVKFYSPRPESFAIYKRTNEKSEWQPYQYYSASCDRTYGVSTEQIVKYGNEAIALCTDEFSDIAPLTGASVVFGTLEDRPSAYNFDNSPELKEWVTATDIRITLTRLNTFGDEVFNDPQVLKSYYYAISGIAVGGRCKCNGHSNRCILEQQHDFEDRLKCDCQHNTAGVDCNECLPFYNDIPWEPATQLSAHECKPCDCNGLSQKCHFNTTLYDMTGHGGFCDDCEGNTIGPHCEECKFGFYRRQNENTCINCNCNPLGSESIQCDPNGRCRCRPGVVGEKCDRCAPNHYELSVTGCKLCSCNLIGSFDSPPICEPINGFCRCKANVEGQNCDRPKPGYFNLSPEHTYGALPCFCYGHSSECDSAQNFTIDSITAKFNDGITPGCFKAIDSRGHKVNTIYFSSKNGVSVSVSSLNDEIYFLASDDFLGNQLYSYNQELGFDMQIKSDQQFSIAQTARASRKDLILESSYQNLEVYLPIYGGSSSVQQNLPSFDKQTFTFKLNQQSGWMPTLSSFEFQRLLSNLTAIKIRASYMPMTQTFISRFVLNTAKLSNSQIESNKAALYVEQCKCPIGYAGQHCDSCAYGYRRDPINSGVYSRCIPCACNNHSLTCDPNNGKCDCFHHTSGENCEKCESGYYGNPLLVSLNKFTPASSLIGFDPNQTPFLLSSVSEQDLSQMCKKCPCPNGGACAEIFNYQLQSVEVVCLECPLGTQGNLCELCDDGYYSSLTSSTCEKCSCNGNIDENAIGNCDTQSSSGEICLRCVYNTTGDNCEKCLPNHYGNALTSAKCNACECFQAGTHDNEQSCNLDNGQCSCKPNVKNRQCNECREGFWNILSGKGCDECRCNPLGSFNLSCSSNNGQCFCRAGVTGLQCDSCKPLHYGFSDEGCKKCDCDAHGTVYGDLQCDEFGKCKCRDGFAGSKCNQCEENRYNFTSGCHKCEDCYNLVQNKVTNLRDRLGVIETTLTDMLTAAANLPENYEEKDESLELIEKLKSLKLLVEDLHMKLFVRGKLKPGYKESVTFLQSEVKKIADNVKSADQTFDQFNLNYKQAEKLFKKLNSSVYLAQTQLDFISIKNKEKKQQLEAIKNEKLNQDHDVRLQNLAKNAREASDQHFQIAHGASELFQKYLTDARKALQQLKDISALQERLEEERQANILMINYEQIKNQTTSLVQEALDQKVVLDQAVKDAKDLIKKLNDFKVPEENTNDSWLNSNKKAADQINKKYNSMKKEINDLKLKFSQLSNTDSLRSIGSAQTYLNEAKIKQKDIDYLLNIAEKTRNQSDSASSLAKQIFENATKIFETLKRFDQLILEGSEKMRKALDLKPLIDDNLFQSEALANKFNKQLRVLNDQIENVKIVSSTSSVMIENVNNTLQNLKKKSSELKNLISKLNERAKDIQKSFSRSTLPKSAEALEIYSNLNNRSDRIQKQAEQVTNGTQKLLDNANNALESLNKINKSLTDLSLSNLKREDIDILQLKFDSLSKEIEKNFQIDEALANLERKTKLSLNIVLQYDFEVSYLRQQVNDLDTLNRTLKSECYKNTIVKPEL